MPELSRRGHAFHQPPARRDARVPPGLQLVVGLQQAFLDAQPPVFVDRYSRATFLGRMADKEDLGGPVIFLLGEAARYITGVNLPVDGGYTAH